MPGVEKSTQAFWHPRITEATLAVMQASCPACEAPSASEAPVPKQPMRAFKAVDNSVHTVGSSQRSYSAEEVNCSPITRITLYATAAVHQLLTEKRRKTISHTIISLACLAAVVLKHRGGGQIASNSWARNSLRQTAGEPKGAKFLAPSNAVFRILTVGVI
jgi:hypothetical protein